MNAYLEIIRPVNGVMAAIAVAVGYFVAGGEALLTQELGYAMLSSFLILSGGMVINDYYDYAIDKKTKKHKPLPSGRISKEVAFGYSVALYLIGNALALAINIETVVIALVASATLVAYAAHFSRIPFTGNFIVAINTALTFVFGAAAAGNAVAVQVIALAGMAFFANLAREVYKSIQDMKEDKGFRETLPMRIGINKSVMIAAFALATAIMLSPIPYWAGVFGSTYLVMISLVDAGLLYTAFTGFRSNNFAREVKYCKVFQFAALIVFLMGSI